MDGQHTRRGGVLGRAVGVLACAAAAMLAACAGQTPPATSSEPPVRQPSSPLGDAVTSTEVTTPNAASGWYTFDTATPSTPSTDAMIAEPAIVSVPPVRYGDEIVVAGRYIRTGAPVVLWTDSGGYAAPATHYGTRFARASGDKPTAGPALMGGRELTATEAARVQAEGWRFDDLTQVVDQFVLHYDVCGVSSECFRVLRLRGLSVHFMLDIDGTIYQTCDVQERAYHATVSNDRSVGIEIANIGAYPPSTLGATADGGKESALQRWYTRSSDGRTVITLPAWMGDGKVRTPGFVGSPARAEPVMGEVQGQMLAQYDLTPQQYDALMKLTSTLCDTFPRLRRDYPREGGGIGEGRVNPRVLSESELASFAGVLGHWHIQQNKIDPGPALDWERVIGH